MREESRLRKVIRSVIKEYDEREQERFNQQYNEQVLSKQIKKRVIEDLKKWLESAGYGPNNKVPVRKLYSDLEYYVND